MPILTVCWWQVHNWTADPGFRPQLTGQNRTTFDPINAVIQAARSRRLNYDSIQFFLKEE